MKGPTVHKCAWRSRRGERGQAVLELALVLVLLLLLLAGAADFGRAFYSYGVITNACREGARYGSHFPHLSAGIRQATKDEAAGSGVVLQDGNISIDPEAAAGADPDDYGVAQPGRRIRVSCELPFPTIMGGLFGLETITLRTMTDMYVFGMDKF